MQDRGDATLPDAKYNPQQSHAPMLHVRLAYFHKHAVDTPGLRCMVLSTAVLRAHTVQDVRT